MGSRITDLTYMNTEHLGEGIVDRKAVFDVYCRLADGSRIIVEMQKAKQRGVKKKDGEMSRKSWRALVL